MNKLNIENVWKNNIEVTNFDNQGTTSKEELINIAVYPNPTTGLVYLNANQVERIEVMDINGRLLGTYTSRDLSPGVLDLSIYKQSICLLKIQDQKGKINHQKIIIIR
jgi:hypothetical protein